MPFFVLLTNPQLPLVVARVVKRRPTGADKDGFTARYVAEVSSHGTEGAEQVIEWLDEAMGKATKAPGVYQSTYDEVRQAYGALIAPHGEARPKHDAATRVAAAVGALALVIGMAAITPWAIIGWLVICAFKTQSGLTTMAETAVVWSILDWRPLIKKLARIARG